MISQVKDMNEILEQALLYDFYGELLTDHQKEVYEKLHLVEKFVSIREKVKQIDELLDGYEKENAEKLVADIRKISDEIIEEL